MSFENERNEIAREKLEVARNMEELHARIARLKEAQEREAREKRQAKEKKAKNDKLKVTIPPIDPRPSPIVGPSEPINQDRNKGAEIFLFLLLMVFLSGLCWLTITLLNKL